MFRFALLAAALAGLLPAQTVYRSRRNLGYGTPNPQSYKGVAGSFRGTLKDLTKKEIMIETDEDQTVSIRVSSKTKFFKAASRSSHPTSTWRRRSLSTRAKTPTSSSPP